jgi:hypothetical protein
MAGPVAWHLQGGPHPAVGIQQGAAWRSRWVSTPMTASTWPSSMGMAVAPSETATVAGTGLGGVTTGGRTMRGHAPGRTGFSIRPATMVGQAGAGSSRTDQPQGTPGGRPARTGVTLPAGASLPAPRPGTISSITARSTASARSMSSMPRWPRASHVGARRDDLLAATLSHSPRLATVKGFRHTDTADTADRTGR